MKGMFGIWVALLLGVAGAFCNWFYLASLSKFETSIEFLRVADNVEIKPGDRFTADNFDRMPVPLKFVGYLEKSAVKYDALNTVVGMTATRPFAAGQVVLQQDLLTPPPPDIKQNLGPDEHVMWLPLDTRVVVPSLMKAGDLVSFRVPASRGPTPATPGTPPPAAPPEGGKARILGPFRILGMGTRLGSSDRLRAVGGNITQENMMAVAVKLKAGQLDPNGEELAQILETTNFQGVQVLLQNEKK